MGIFIIKPLICNAESLDIINLMVRQLILTYCSIFFLIIRDVIGEKSFGKRIMRLNIINKENGNEAKYLNRLIRNITWVLGPIEIIVFLIAKERIGDKVAKTSIVEEQSRSVNKLKKNQQNEF